MRQHIVNCSLGKDSVALLYLMIQKKMRIDQVMFADIPGAEFDETYIFMKKLEQKLGIEIELVRSSRWASWDEYFYAPMTKGKRIGHGHGFPPVVGKGCAYKREFKVNPMKNVRGIGNIIYLGIAYDEAHRAEAKQYRDGKNEYRFPLIEWKLTEAQCRAICEENGILHPLYRYFRRLGCWQCPKQPLPSLRSLYQFWPEKWKQLEQYQLDCAWSFKPGWTVQQLSERFAQELSPQ